MSPILPLLGLGALVAVALASSKSSASEAPPQLPDGSAPPPGPLPAGATPIQKLQAALTEQGASLAQVNDALAASDNPQLLAMYADRLANSSLANDPAIRQTIDALRAKSQQAAYGTTTTTGPLVLPKDDAVVTQSPGVWQGLSVAQQNRVAGILIALGVDPQTGQLKPGVAPSQEAVAVATAYAAELGRYRHATASQALRKYAEQAASAIPCKPPEAFATLPGELACAISRTSEMEKDPKKLRAFIGRLQPYAHIPQVKLVIDTLESEARHIESLQDQADALAKTDAIQKDQPVPEPEPPGMSPQLKNAMAQALERLKNEADKNAPGFATQIGLLLKENGFPEESKQIIALANALKAKQAGGGTVTPSAGTYTVKSGDYPFAIAKRFTGDGNRWRELQAANPQYNFSQRFLAGYVLKLPASWTSSSTAITPMLAPTVAPAPEAVVVPTERTYTVKRGDYPYGLAQKWTGDGNRWRELQALNPQYSFTKSFLAGYVLKIPSSWPAKPATIAGDCVGGDCGCVGGDCACVGCGPVIVGAEPGDSFRLATHFEERGGKLYAHGYLHDKRTGPKIFSVSVDMRPIARAVARMHKKLHERVAVSGLDPNEVELVGVSPDYVGECIQVGKLRFRLRRKKKGSRTGLLKKLGRSVKKVARGKAIKKMSKAARDIVDPRKYKGIKKASLSVAAAIYPPAGAPALKAYKTSLVVAKTLEKNKAKTRKLRNGLKKGLKKVGNATKLKRYAQKTFTKSKSQLASRVKRGGLMSRISKLKSPSLRKAATSKLAQKISSAAKQVTAKKLGQVLRKAPSLRRTLARRSSLLKAAAVAKQRIQSSASSELLAKAKEMAARAKQGDVKAQKASRIMSTVLESQHRINQRTRRELPAGTTGILIDAQGRTVHGRYVREPSGQSISTLLTSSGKMPGYYRRVAG